jgi:ribulose-phosphate 3-epimerase
MAATTAFDLLREAAPTLSVGAVSANLMALGVDLAALQDAGVRVLHFDIMDGKFTPVLTVGPAFVKGIVTPLFKDVHLMIDEPLETLGDYVKAGADIITFQIESTRHIHRALQALGGMQNANDAARGIVRGIGLNPGTPLPSLAPILDDIDMILLLAVNPGWGGQGFIQSTVARIQEAKQMIASSGRDILLCVDGAITRENIAAVAGLGVDLIVSGSAVFQNNAPAENARFMLAACAAGQTTR